MIARFLKIKFNFFCETANILPTPVLQHCNIRDVLCFSVSENIDRA